MDKEESVTYLPLRFPTANSQEKIQFDIFANERGNIVSEQRDFFSHIAGAVIDIFVPFQARKYLLFGPKYIHGQSISPRNPCYQHIGRNPHHHCNHYQAGGTVWFADRDALKGSLVQV